MMLTLGIYTPAHRRMATHNIGWRILCEQEKTPFIVTSQPECPIMVFDGETPDWFARFLTDGGIGIVTDCRPDLLPFEVEYIGDASIEIVDLTDLGSRAARVPSITRLYRGDGYGKIRIHEKRVYKGGLNQDEFPIFLSGQFGKGSCFYTGLPVSRLVTALGDTLRETTSFIHYTERVASVDKHHLMKAMREILIRAFHQRDLPYVHLGYFPGDFQSALAFRIDVDGVFGENLIRISKSALENEFNLTFFANKSLCKEDGEFIQKIDPAHEIGNHADVHNLFTEVDANLRNIQECKNWLSHLGIEDQGRFAAPRGMWNNSLHQALNALGYRYTSDFGAAIGGFPYFPYIQGIRSGTLQIPVNPFSAERAAIWRREAENQEITPEYIADVFIQIVDENYQQGYPSILYSHPEKFGSMADFVFQRINEKIAGLNLWKTTLTQFADWWFKRDKIKYSTDYTSSTRKTLLTQDLDADVRIKEV